MGIPMGTEGHLITSSVAPLTADETCHAVFDPLTSGAWPRHLAHGVACSKLNGKGNAKPTGAARL
jgi:hypothetical protein